MRLSLATLIFASACASGAQSAADLSGIRLAPHKVVYDLSMASSRGARGLEAARGRIVFDFTGDGCDGYAMNYRQVTVLESGETGARTSDLRSNTFEGGKGETFQFKTDSRLEAVTKSLDGTAARRDGTLSIELAKPKRETLSVGGDPQFPTAHMKLLIKAALAGETTVGVKVFDGSDDGRKVYDTLGVIGRRIEPGVAAGLEDSAQIEALTKLPRWPVTLSYFAPGDGERTPVYVISFELYENGVSRALRLDYGDFALKGDMKTLEMIKPSSCEK